MTKHFTQRDPVTAAARAMARLSRTSVRHVSWRVLAAVALEAARASDALFTDSEKGTAIGSATETSSSKTITLGRTGAA
jgi:hypothetical protein